MCPGLVQKSRACGGYAKKNRGTVAAAIPIPGGPRLPVELSERPALDSPQRFNPPGMLTALRLPCQIEQPETDRHAR